MKREESCGMLFKQVHDYLEKKINNSLRSSDLTMVQLATLLILRESDQGRLTLKELEKKLHVAQSTAAGIVSRLEQKSFVESYNQPEDLRVKVVCITKAGEKCCEGADENFEKIEKELLRNLSKTEKKELLALLKKLEVEEE